MNGTDFYLFNAHGDVIELADSTGASTRAYDYDAFGVEKDPDPLDENPFRYCGEYFDRETETYYLRARYYDPTIGRFTQQDTHWTTANSIYGDNPQKINEHEDKLGLKSYSYAPQITAVMQSGNLYVYGVNSPIQFKDTTGQNIAYVMSELAEFFPAFMTGVASAIVAIKAAIASAASVIGAFVGILAGIAIVDYLIHEIEAHAKAAEDVREWAKAAEGIQKEELRDNSVYIITNASSEVVYVGRTSNYARRQYSHQEAPNSKYKRKDGYSMKVVATGMTLPESRALEQILIVAFSLEALNNVINSIAEMKWDQFWEEFNRMCTLVGCAYDDLLS